MGGLGRGWLFGVPLTWLEFHFIDPCLNSASPEAATNRGHVDNWPTPQLKNPFLKTSARLLLFTSNWQWFLDYCTFKPLNECFHPNQHNVCIPYRLVLYSCSMIVGIHYVCLSAQMHNNFHRCVTSRWITVLFRWFLKHISSHLNLSKPTKIQRSDVK